MYICTFLCTEPYDCTTFEKFLLFLSHWVIIIISVLALHSITTKIGSHNKWYCKSSLGIISSAILMCYFTIGSYLPFPSIAFFIIVTHIAVWKSQKLLIICWCLMYSIKYLLIWYHHAFDKHFLNCLSVWIVSSWRWLHEIWDGRLHPASSCGSHVSGQACVRGNECKPWGRSWLCYSIWGLYLRGKKNM